MLLYFAVMTHLHTAPLSKFSFATVEMPLSKVVGKTFSSVSYNGIYVFLYLLLWS